MYNNLIIRYKILCCIKLIIICSLLFMKYLTTYFTVHNSHVTYFPTSYRHPCWSCITKNKVLSSYIANVFTSLLLIPYKKFIFIHSSKMVGPSTNNSQASTSRYRKGAMFTFSMPLLFPVGSSVIILTF